MAFYRLIPQMAGFASSDGTKGDQSTPGPQLEFLEFFLDSEPLSDIIGEDNIFLATELLVNELRVLQPSGVVFHHDNVRVLGDINFESGVFQTDNEQWWWLQLLGIPGTDDFGFADGMILSQRVMDIFNKFRLDYCIFEETQSRFFPPCSP